MHSSTGTCNGSILHSEKKGSHPLKALLIIDMQVGSFAQTPRFDADGMVHRINLLAEFFRRKKQPVIFIQHDGTKEVYLFTGTDDWKILPGLIQRETDVYIEKTANDAFYHTNLDEYLRANKIDEVFISGCATDFCVNATVHSALVKNYHITIAKDCHTTADRPNLTAEQLIVFHNWLWENLTPTEGSIQIKGMNEIVEDSTH
jgi:nicotinamidase-related amidase